MGSHFHLILRAPKMNLHKFMQYFQSYFARAVNRLRKRFDASVFPRRYAAEPLLDEDSLLEKMRCGDTQSSCDRKTTMRSRVMSLMV